MERVTDTTNHILATLMDSYQVVRRRPQFKVYPQMPISQINHFVNQAAQHEYNVVVQLNPSSFSHALSEVVGKLSLSVQSNHVILTPQSGNTFHLIQPQNIRHLRISHSDRI